MPAILLLSPSGTDMHVERDHEPAKAAVGSGTEEVTLVSDRDRDTQARIAGAQAFDPTATLARDAQLLAFSAGAR
jgi:hypothetical protein